ncbi:primosomal protein N' [Lactobacillaceae bacterium L1_55_11]|nr:primosomal protein N' [Lactobacillaceae bacterium L1_55_11]
MNQDQFAQVIVDVPTQQTNQPYTYQIPADLKDLVVPGVRVEVPFGHRQVMGFVVGLSPDSDLTSDQLKSVQACLDLTPVLDAELLELSKKLAKDIFAFRITVLLAMLPNALKTDYQRVLQPENGLSDELRQQYFGSEDSRVFDWDDYTPKQAGVLAQLLRDGLISQTVRVSNRGRVKTQLAYQLNDDEEWLAEQLAKLRKNARQQQHLLAFIQEYPGQVFTKKELMEMVDVSAATLRQGEKKGFLKAKQVEKLRRPGGQTPVQPSQPLALNPGQQTALDEVLAAYQQHQYQPFLLEGITGSGKTEVYLQAAQEVIAAGQTVLFLVPEIALTPQMLNRVRSRFGQQTAVLHSGLSAGERYDEWRRIQRGDVQVVVGARSAVFAPLTNLGLIIVDEEHEVSYQQVDNPRYNARDVALWRGRYHQIPVVLGSATPSLESRARAQRHRYELLRLTERAGGAQLPPVELVDMREMLAQGPDDNVSPVLREKLQQRLARGEQSVLLLNRRGYSSFVMCRTCGFVPRDPNCNLAMTLHMDTKTLKCHYCGYEAPIPKTCPQCDSKRIRYYGTGTEKVEEELREILPEARVIRVDQDTTRRKGSLEKALAVFDHREADILLGTQMVAKGLDFPNVTLVGVLNADTALGLPDFHASERTFQLLTQVAGRAGRADKAGEVVIQTFNPEHYAIQLVRRHDYEGFYAREMAIRHAGEYPPYFYTIQIQTSHLDEGQLALQTAQLARWLHRRAEGRAIILGPSPKPIAKMRGRYYFQMILKLKDPHVLDPYLDELVDRSQRAKGGLQVTVVRNPVSFM